LRWPAVSVFSFSKNRKKPFGLSAESVFSAARIMSAKDGSSRAPSIA
jgi:hypothetical protein